MHFNPQNVIVTYLKGHPYCIAKCRHCVHDKITHLCVPLLKYGLLVKTLYFLFIYHIYIYDTYIYDVLYVNIKDTNFTKNNALISYNREE